MKYNISVHYKNLGSTQLKELEELSIPTPPKYIQLFSIMFN